jgi:hypothetical protein
MRALVRNVLQRAHARLKHCNHTAHMLRDLVLEAALGCEASALQVVACNLFAHARLQV